MNVEHTGPAFARGQSPAPIAWVLGGALLASAALSGCGTARISTPAEAQARLAPATTVTRDLTRLPEAKGKIAVAVYGFRDQTGQYKPAPDSSFSTAVTQGAASMLVKALQDSRWFIPVERENLQDLLTERKIVRALETPQEKNTPVPQSPQIPQLLPASVIVEGGITAYESNVRTGGAGANFLGIGVSSQYRVDQVTVNLRSVDIRTGRILTTVSTTKSIYSYEIRPSVFKFVNFKDLAQFESGMTRNEPSQLCVREAIEAAVVFLVVQGVNEHHWELKDEKDWANPLIKAYAGGDSLLAAPAVAGAVAALP
jgi:curli production assembly/transport component CsgG